MSDVKLCRDCRWSKNGWECDAPPNVKTAPDYVNGGTKTVREYNACAVLRDFEGEKFCGPEAKWFQSKEPSAQEPVGFGSVLRPAFT